MASIQAFLIAPVLPKHLPILLSDAATGELDAAMERLVQDAIDAAARAQGFAATRVG